MSQQDEGRTLHSLSELKSLTDPNRPSLTEDFLHFPESPESVGSRTILHWMRSVADTLEQKQAYARAHTEKGETNPKHPAYITKEEGVAIIGMLEKIDTAWDFDRKKISEPDATLRYLTSKAILLQTIQRHADKGLFKKVDAPTRNTLDGFLKDDLPDLLRNRAVVHTLKADEPQSFLVRLMEKGDEAVSALIGEKLTPGEWLQAAAHIIDIESQDALDQQTVRITTNTHTYAVTPDQAAKIIAVEEKIAELRARKNEDGVGKKLRSAQNRRSRLYGEIGITSSTKYQTTPLFEKKGVDQRSGESNGHRRFSTTHQVQVERQAFFSQLQITEHVEYLKEMVDKYRLRDRLAEVMVGGVDNVKSPNEANSAYRHRFINKLRAGFSNLLSEHQSALAFAHMGPDMTLYDKTNQANSELSHDLDSLAQTANAVGGEFDLTDPEIASEFNDLVGAVGDQFYTLDLNQQMYFLGRWMQIESPDEEVALQQERELIKTIEDMLSAGDEEDTFGEESKPRSIGILETLPADIHLDPRVWTHKNIVHEGHKQTVEEFFRAFYMPLPSLDQTEGDRDLTDMRTIVLHQSELGQQYDHMTIYRYNSETGDMQAYSILIEDFNSALGLDDKDRIYLDRKAPQERNEDIIWRKVQRIAGFTRENGFLVESFPTDLETRTDLTKIPSQDADRIGAWFAAMRNMVSPAKLRYVHVKGQFALEDMLVIEGRENDDELSVTMREFRNVLDLPRVPLYEKFDKGAWKENVIELLRGLRVDGHGVYFNTDDFRAKDVEVRLPSPAYNGEPLKENKRAYEILESIAGAWDGGNLQSVELVIKQDGSLDGLAFRTKEGKGLFIFASSFAKAFGIEPKANRGGIQSFTVDTIMVNANIEPESLKRALSNLVVRGKHLSKDVAVTVKKLQHAYTPRIPVQANTGTQKN